MGATVAIAGFTGRLARLITEALVRQHPGVVVHGICRSPEKVDPKLRSISNVKVFQASSDDAEAIKRALLGVDVCICCYLGDNGLMIEGQKTLVDACIAAGVQRYIASDWCLDYRPLELGDHPTKDPMIIMRAYLEEKEKAGSISGVHILNGALTEVAWAPFVGWVDAANATFRYYGTGDEPLDMTTMPDAAEYTAEVAYDKSAKGFFQIVGDRISVKGMAQAYSHAYGVEPKVECQGSLDELYKSAKESFKQDPKNAYAWMGPHYQYYMGNGSTTLRGTLDHDRYLGFKPKSVEEFLKEYTKDSVGNAYRSM
ncbi:Uu.00g016850.m01.CDS01 [Anthostomella pinea]|uniref:Uu.00g016850.m01.CDS01 n=1 Tax=Anthostomella pinea TaxID=933095 RepID=A0AAI8YQL7_9PEZI|nr:Uu.00g016850.m01.CDS01 [Anthostomella pinea]